MPERLQCRRCSISTDSIGKVTYRQLLRRLQRRTGQSALWRHIATTRTMHRNTYGHPRRRQPAATAHRKLLRLRGTAYKKRGREPVAGRLHGRVKLQPLRCADCSARRIYAQPQHRHSVQSQPQLQLRPLRAYARRNARLLGSQHPYPRLRVRQSRTSFTHLGL